MYLRSTVESFSGRYSVRRGSLEIPTNTECDNLHGFCMYTNFADFANFALYDFESAT